MSCRFHLAIQIVSQSHAFLVCESRMPLHTLTWFLPLPSRRLRAVGSDNLNESLERLRKSNPLIDWTATRCLVVCRPFISTDRVHELDRSTINLLNRVSGLRITDKDSILMAGLHATPTAPPTVSPAVPILSSGAPAGWAHIVSRSLSAGRRMAPRHNGVLTLNTLGTTILHLRLTILAPCYLLLREAGLEHGNFLHQLDQASSSALDLESRTQAFAGPP